MTSDQQPKPEKEPVTAGSRPLALLFVALFVVALLVGLAIVTNGVQRGIGELWQSVTEMVGDEMAPSPAPLPPPRAELPKLTLPKLPTEPPRVDARPPRPPVPSSPRADADPLPGPAAPEADSKTAPRPLATVDMTVAPRTPWLPLSDSVRLDRIAVGSCMKQTQPAPIWNEVLAAKPQVFLMIGDNVYGDFKTPDGRDLIRAYNTLLAQPEFVRARRTLPFLATWDDHDYGLNDGGSDFAYREQSERLFREFWGMPAKPGAGPGIEYSRIVGPPGEQVQIIMLDTRSFRSTLKLDPGVLWGRYVPDPDPSKTMLGDAQWAWLEKELERPAGIRIIVSSIQVLAEGHGWERWGNLPRERDKFLALIARTKAKGVILLSGDRHVAAIYGRTIAGNQTVPELTSSSLNAPASSNKDVPSAELLSEIYLRENFGLVDIDWAQRNVRLSIKGLGGADVEEIKFKFSDLGYER